MSANHCPACGGAWQDHASTVELCRENAELRMDLADARKLNADLVAAIEATAAAMDGGGAE